MWDQGHGPGGGHITRSDSESGDLDLVGKVDSDGFSRKSVPVIYMLLLDLT